MSSAKPLTGTRATPPSGAQTSEQRLQRVVQQISGFADAAAAAQEALSTEQIFNIARERLLALDLRLLFTEVHGDTVVEFNAGDDLQNVFTAFMGRSEPRAITGLPVQNAIRANPRGVLVEDLRTVWAQALSKPLAEIDAPEGLDAIGAAIQVSGAVAYHAVAMGFELDRSLAPAFGHFARQLGMAIETAHRIEDLARSNRELTTINHVARAAATLGSGRALEPALEELARSLQIDGVALFRREGNELVLAVHLGMPEEWVASSARIALRAETPWSESLRSPPPGSQPRFALHKPDDSIAIPLRAGPAGDELQGVLIASRSIAPLAGDELRLLNTVSAQIAVSMHNAILFQQAQRRVREQSLLLELGQAVSGKLDQREMLREGARVAARVLRCSAAYIFAPDALGSSLGCAAFEDPAAPTSLVSRLPLDRPSLTALAFRSGKPQFSADSSSDPRIDRDLTSLFGCRSTLAVPLNLHQRTLGVLLLIERSPDRHFNDEDTPLAMHAAQLLAASMENATLYAEQHRRADEMSQLNQLTRALVGSFELEPMLIAASESLRQVLDVAHAVVYLFDEKGQNLVARTAPPDFPQLLGRQFPLDKPSAASAAVWARHALQFRNLASSTVVTQTIVKMLGTKTLLAVPLIAREEVVGAVVFSEIRNERVFTAAEEELATVVSGQIAMAIITARLIEDLRRSYSDLKRTQGELVDRERLAALGELSASIAHEVRNPLGVIFNAVGSLRRLVNHEGNIDMLLDIVGEEADRLNRMVGDLLDYSRPYSPALQAVPLAPLLAESLAAARSQGARKPDGSPVTDEGMQIEMKIPPQLTLSADPRLLRQALVNLFLNAFQAMPKGGLIQVLAEEEKGPFAPEARVRIRDNGPGIPEAVRPRVFHPFFTTKATGTGLGLALVKRIIEGHGGRISVRNSEEPGAEFELSLPLWTASGEL